MLPKGIPTSLAAVVAAFEPCFSKPTHGRFVVLVLGWLQCRSRRWITRVILAACGRSMGHHAAFYRFFSEASWHPTDVWRTLFLRLLRHVDGVLELIIDDTLCQRSGPRIFGISMHYDGANSAYRPSGHRGARTACGHSWVVLALRVPSPWPGPGIAVPIHARLYRSPKRCPESEYRTRTELGAEMLEDVLRWLPDGRRLHLLGDREYACRTLLRKLDERIDFTGPMPLDAALYAPHDGKPQVGRGRRRLKGARLSSPQVTVTKRPSSWKTQRVQMYGRAVRLQMQSWTCLWYTATGLRLIRVVVTRDPAGRYGDRAYFTTAHGCAPRAVIERFARRWLIETSFRESKQALGMAEAQNGWSRGPKAAARPKPGPNPRGELGRRTVERTAPFALIVRGILVVWYLERNRWQKDIAMLRRRSPWYTSKATPSFEDMLEAVRADILDSRIDAIPALQRLSAKFRDSIMGLAVAG